MDSLDSLLLSVPISHHSWKALKMASSFCTELMNVSFCCLYYPVVSMSRSPLENITYEFILTFPTKPSMSCSSWIICEMGDIQPYSQCFEGCSFQDLFRMAHISHQAFFFRHFIKVLMVLPYNSTAMATAWKKSSFTLSDRSNFHMIDNMLFVSVHVVHPYSSSFLKVPMV